MSKLVQDLTSQNHTSEDPFDTWDEIVPVPLKREPLNSDGGPSLRLTCPGLSINVVSTAGQTASSPFMTGELISVISLHKNVAFIEGLAVIKGPAKGLNRFRIRFIGDVKLHDRVVHRIYQRAPEEAISWLNALLREPSEERLDDFFPSDDQFGG